MEILILQNYTGFRHVTRKIFRVKGTFSSPASSSESSDWAAYNGHWCRSHRRSAFIEQIRMRWLLKYSQVRILRRETQLPSQLALKQRSLDIKSPHAKLWIYTFTSHYMYLVNHLWRQNVLRYYMDNKTMYSTCIRQYKTKLVYQYLWRDLHPYGHLEVCTEFIL